MYTWKDTKLSSKTCLAIWQFKESNLILLQLPWFKSCPRCSWYSHCCFWKSSVSNFHSRHLGTTNLLNDAAREMHFINITNMILVRLFQFCWTDIYAFTHGTLDFSVYLQTSNNFISVKSLALFDWSYCFPIQLLSVIYKGSHTVVSSKLLFIGKISIEN